MKLFTCLDIAEACGLETLKEAYVNIDYHATNTFVYDEIEREMTELVEDYCKYGFATKEEDSTGKVTYSLTSPDLSIFAALDKMNEIDGTDLTFTEYSSFEEGTDEGI